MLAGKGEAALAALMRLAAKSPRDAEVAGMLSMVLSRLGRHEPALFYARRAVELVPDHPRLLLNLATSGRAALPPAEAMAALQRAVVLAPGDLEIRLSLVNELLVSHRAAEAAEHCRVGLAAGPNAAISVSYANALLALGDVEGCVTLLREAKARFPDDATLAAFLPMAMCYLWGADPAERAAAHRAYGRLLDRTRPAISLSHQGVKDPERRLRVGFVSPDLRSHSVAFFVEPFFEHHDRRAFEVVAYATGLCDDATSARLRGHAALWRDAAGLTDVGLARLANAERVDVLVDLAGHTLYNSLPAFNLRPAPVQATYCGYPDSTGVSAMGYRIVDARTDPPGAADTYATERLWRLDPCFLCYRPPEGAPAPTRDAAAAGSGSGGVVFGSFNASKKVNRTLIGVWARVLHAVPGSRLLLKAQDFNDPTIPAGMRERFAAHGIGPERLDLLAGTKGIAEHLALYARMDIALDTLPYNGTTTTCEALHMGVPVVTMAGDSHPGRVGVSLLGTLGLDELIAPDVDGYVAIAAALAADPARLASYRSTLRGRLSASPLCDGPGFAARFGDALRGMWRERCART